MKKPDQDLPSFLNNWNQFYGVVVVWLVFLILVFWLVTIAFK